ncbi:MAG: protein TolR [Acidobacteria bacterium]|nr:protein TolR [Acidobacteriota bacterium]
MMMGNSGEEGLGPLSEINVTPLVDVMLVLLIIFMVTAPMLQRSVDVQLPKVESGTDARDQNTIVTIDRQNRLYLNQRRVHPDLLGKRLNEILATRRNPFVFLRADEAVSYGRVMMVMNEIKQAGVEQVGLVTEPPARKRKR